MTFEEYWNSTACPKSGCTDVSLHFLKPLYKQVWNDAQANAFKEAKRRSQLVNKVELFK